MEKKIGIDIHGVIDSDPEAFSLLTKLFRADGHEIHIVTGRELNDEILDKLDEFDIQYDYIFSITSYHKKIGTPMDFKNGDPSQPLIDGKVWDRTKAEYAERVGLDIHIDDSEIYGKYFTSECDYIYFGGKVAEFINSLFEASKEKHEKFIP